MKDQIMISIPEAAVVGPNTKQLVVDQRAVLLEAAEQQGISPAEISELLANYEDAIVFASLQNLQAMLEAHRMLKR